MHTFIILMLILAILLVIFTLQNAIGITINVFFWKIEQAPLVLVILSCVVLGYILAAIYYLPRILKLKKEYRNAVKSGEKFRNQLEPDRSPREDPGPEGIDLEIDDEGNDNGFFR